MVGKGNTEIYIPIGKALIAVESDFSEQGGRCGECALGKICYNTQHEFACNSTTRKDKKNVNFKIVDITENSSIA